MKIISRVLPVFLFLLLSSGYSFAQASARIDSASLQGQYQVLLNKSRSLDGYKVVNPERLAKLWRSVSDSLKASRRQVATLRSKTSEQEKTILDQQGNLSQQKKTLEASNARLDQVVFLGIPMNESAFQTVVLVIFIGLALSLAFVIFRSAGYRREAKYRIKLFEELSGEFQTYKVKANEKEKKLARELQDERNKLDDLLRK
jgi:hypothetical protein